MDKDTEELVQREHRHPTVHLQHGSMEADIDVEIAPLVLEIWKAGIETESSCQDFPEGYIWLQFWHQDELIAFLNIVGSDTGAMNLNNHMGHGYNRTPPLGNNQWQYVLVIYDWAVEDRDPVDTNRNLPDFHVAFSVHIPKAHVPELLSRLQAHNAANVPMDIEEVTGDAAI